MNNGRMARSTELAVAVKRNRAGRRKPPAVAPGLSQDEVERRLMLYGTTAPDWAFGRTPRQYVSA